MYVMICERVRMGPLGCADGLSFERKICAPAWLCEHVSVKKLALW
jgi:hypothetical protein